MLPQFFKQQVFLNQLIFDLFTYFKIFLFHKYVSSNDMVMNNFKYFFLQKYVG